MSYLRIFGAIILTATIVIFGLVRLSFEVIGASTAPDDFALLKQRMPKILEWLFTTPWWVPTLFLILIAGAAAWLFITGNQNSAVKEICAQNQLTEDQLRLLVETRFAEMYHSQVSQANVGAVAGGEALEVATLRSRLTKSQDDLAHLLAVTDDLRTMIETADASLGKQIVDLDERQNQTVAELKEAQRLLDNIIRVGKSAIFAAEMLPRAKALLDQAETETKRTPPRLPADGEFIPPLRREPGEKFGEFRSSIQVFQNQLREHFTEKEVGQLTGGIIVEVLGRANEIPLSPGDEAFFRDGVHKLNWARFMDQVNGTHSRMAGLVSFLESKRNIVAELAKVE